MNKLIKLRAWLNLDEATEHLTLLFGERITISDLLRLALDGHLTLSVRFVNNAKARVGPVVSMSEAKQMEFTFADEVYTLPSGLQLND